MYRSKAMREASFTELRNQARHFFDLVEAGEVVRVLRNGKAIAEIRPVQHGGPSWKQRKARPLAVSGVDIGRLILGDRGR
jgi:antitoxin (DNA-binding transcriptional repressor) of toxin-antitoxin stability system